MKQLIILLLSLFVLLSPGALLGEWETTGSGKASEMRSNDRRIVFNVNTRKCLLCIKIFDTVYAEAFKRIGYKFSTEFVPLKRSLMVSNSGWADGETARVQFNAELQKQYPNLIRIDEPIWEVATAAYATDSSLMITGWESLRGLDLVIAYPRGHKHIEKNLFPFVAEKNRHNTTDTIQMLRMLKLGRIDIAIESSITIRGIIRSDEFKDVKIHQVGTLDSILLYPYLHKKHIDLVPQLEAALRSMKTDGTFDKLVLQAEIDAARGTN